MLAPRARRDLQEAWTYSRDQWGARRADSYVRDLNAAILRIGAHPMAGQACDEIRPGYRKHPAGSHMLFYQIREDAVVVIRVLHQQMDVQDKL
ncbi:MAG TPA: type II toxin-antitoxin system RelE/ParE family toxin [Caulobacter sp.]|nr:type II toxin-antitoxin system RelE/ParE family toxin [Caulobacter sp.]